MIRKTSLSLVLCTFSFALFFSCSEESTEPTQANPKLAVSSESCMFTKNFCQDILIISNEGAGELTWQIESKPAWIELSKQNGTITTGNESVTISANMEQLTESTSGMIELTSNGGDIDVPVNGYMKDWVRLADMPSARMFLASCVFNNIIYAIGGSDINGNEVGTVEAYDPSTNEWSTKSAMPTPRSGLTVCVLEKKIYAIGGGVGEWEQKGLPLVEVYDPAQDSWSAGVDLPAGGGRIYHGTSVVNGKIYVIAGWYVIAADGPRNTVFEFDPVSQQWEQKSPIPTMRAFFNPAVVNNKIYIMGGHTWAQNELKVNELYNPLTDGWETKASMTLGAVLYGGGVVDGKIYIVGGSRYPYIFRQEVQIYNPVTDSWSSGPKNLPTPRLAFTSSTVNGQIFIIGGSLETDLDGAPSKIVEAYDP